MKGKREVRSKTPGLKRAFKRAAVSACAAAAVSLALAMPAFAACGPVVLDAGHGGGDSGAVGNGLTESNLTWRITKYAEERLKQLGIPTVMARVSENSNPSLYQRNKVAQDVKARAIVSFHINSGGGTGAEVLVANNAAYNNFCASETQSFGRDVLSRLSSLGLYNRGNKPRDYPSGSTVSLYASAQSSDYYAIVRNARASGFSGTIIEHGFIDRGDDALKFKSDAFLKQLGYADAEAIARQWPNSYSRPAASSYSSRWVASGSRWRWFDVSGSYGSYAAGKWIDSGGSRYYIGGDTYMVTGWAKISNQWYYFNAPNGDMAKGWKQVGGQWYWLRPSGNSYGPVGSMGTGWLQLDGQWYYLDGSGARVEGWRDIDGKRYYFTPGSGRMVTGVQTINGVQYRFDGSGACQGQVNKTGWSFENGAWYYYENGKKATGWKDVSGQRYYLDPANGAMAQGWKKVSGTWYWFRTSSGSGPAGSLGRGWLSDGGQWYFLDRSSGAMRTGWVDDGGARYWLRVDSSSGPEGSMGTGWLARDGHWYFLDRSSGAMARGWRDIDGKRYWFDTSGAMATGTRTIDGKTCVFDASGALVSQSVVKSGWQTEGSARCYYENGRKVTGWKSLDGHWFFFDRSSGAMRTGWISDGGKRYYLRTSSAYGPVGSMGTGWLSDGGKRYFLDRSSGAAASGVRVVDGRVCNFASDGALVSDGPLNAWYDASWRPSSSTVSGSKVHYFDASGREVYTRTTNTPVMGSSSMSRDAFVKAFAARIQANYPQVYRTDAKYGATTPEAFARAAWDAATSEGVRPEVLAAQVGNETGWLKFGGIVNANQCNFGGLGALDGNANGNAATFATVQQGLLAQAQHLKAYSSKAALGKPCVDPRFNLVTRGIAPYLEDYGADGHGGLVWASNRLYGRDLLAAMRSITG